MIAKIASKLKVRIPPTHGISARIIAPNVGTSGRNALSGTGKEYDFYTKIVGVPYIVGYDVINRDIPFDGGIFDETQISPDGRISLTPTGITNGVGYYTTPVIDLGDQYFMESIGLDQIVNLLAQITKIEVKVNDKPSGDPSWASMSWSEYPTDLNNQGKQYIQIKLTFSSDVSNTYTPVLRTINIYRDFTDDDDIFILGSEFPFADGIFSDTVLNKSRHVELDVDGGDYVISGYWLSPVIDLGVGRYFKSLIWESREPEGTEIDSTPGDPKTIALRASFTSPVDLSSNPSWMDFTDWSLTGLSEGRTVSECGDISTLSVGDVPLMISKNVSIIDNPDDPGENVIECKGSYPEVRAFDYQNKPYQTFAPTRILEEFEPIVDGEVQFDTKFIETNNGVVISAMEYLTDVWQKKYSNLLVKDGKIYDLPLAMFSEKVELGDVPYDEWLSLRIAVDILNNTSKLHVDKLIDDCDDPTWTDIGSALVATIDDYHYIHGIASLRGGKDDSAAQFGYTHPVSSLNLSGGRKYIDVLIEDLTDIKDSGTAVMVVFQSSAGNYYNKVYTKAELVENQFMTLGGEEGDFAEAGSADWAVINTIRIWLWTNNATDEIPVGGVIIDYWRQNLVEADLEVKEVTAGINALELRAFPSTCADISESFSGTSLDSGKWEFTESVADDELNETYVDNGLFTDFTYRPVTSLVNAARLGIESLFELTGDFIIEVDWEWIKSGWGNAYIPEGLQFYVTVFNSDDNSYDANFLYDNETSLLFQGMTGSETHGNNLYYRGLRLLRYEDTRLVERSGTIGEPVLLQQLAHKVRLRRNYNLITFEYWDGSEWIEDGRETIFNDLPVKLRVASDIWDDTYLPWSVKVNSINITGPNTDDLTDTEFLIKNIRSIYNPASNSLQLDGVDSGEAKITYDTKDDREISVITAEIGNNIIHSDFDRGRNLNRGRFKSIAGEKVLEDTFDNSSIHAGWTTDMRNNGSVVEGVDGAILYTSTDDDSVARLIQNIDNLALKSDVEFILTYERPIWPAANLPSSLLYDIVVEPATKYIVTFTDSNTDPSTGFITEWTNEVPLSGISNTECYIGYNAGSPDNLDANGYGELIDQDDKGVPTTTSNGIWFYQDTDNSFKLVINNTGSEPFFASGEIYIPGEITISSITKDASPHTPTGKDERIRIHNWFNSLRLIVEATNRGIIAAVSRITDSVGSRFLTEFIGIDCQSNWNQKLPRLLDGLHDRTEYLASDLAIYSSSNVPPDRVGVTAGPVETTEENNQEGTSTYRKFTSNVSLVTEEKIRIRNHGKTVTEPDEFNDQLSRNWLIFEYQTDAGWVEITRIETDFLHIKNFMVECSNTKTRKSLQVSLKNIEVICAGDVLANPAKPSVTRLLSEFSVTKVTGPGSATLNIVGAAGYVGYQKGNYVITVETGPVLRIQEPNGNEYTNVSVGSQTYYIPGNLQFAFSNHFDVGVGDQWIINVEPMGNSYKFNTRKARYVRHYAWGSNIGNGTHWCHLGIFNESTQDLALRKYVHSNYRFTVDRPGIPPFTIDPATMIRIATDAWIGYERTSGGPGTGGTFNPEDIFYPSNRELWQHSSSHDGHYACTGIKLDMRQPRTFDAISIADGLERDNDKITDTGYYSPGDGDSNDRITVWGSNDNSNWTKIAQFDRYRRYYGRRIIEFNPVTYRYIILDGGGNTNDYLKYADRGDTYYAYIHVHSMEENSRRILTNNYLYWSHAYSGYTNTHDNIGKLGESSHPYVEVDLGSLQDINEIYIAMYHKDNRTFYNQLLQISEDGIHWETVWMGLNPTGGGYIEGDSDVIDIKKRLKGVSAIRPELLPATGWIAQLEIDDIEPEYDNEIHALSVLSSRDAGIADLDGPSYNDNNYSDNRRYHYGLHNDIAVAGIKLFNKHRFNYTRFGGFFEVEGADGIYRVWNHRTRQWVVYSELDRSLKQLDYGDPALSAGPANPDWPPVSFLWDRNTKYIFELERTYLPETSMPILRRLQFDWYSNIDKTYDSHNNRFGSVVPSSEQGSQYSSVYNQKYYGQRLGDGVNPTPYSESLYNNVIDRFSFYKKINGVLKGLEDDKNLATLKIYNGDFHINDNVYKIIYADAFYAAEQNILPYTYIDFWYQGALRTKSTSPPFSDYFVWGTYHNIHCHKGDNAGGTGMMWTGKPIDVSKGAIIQWNAWFEHTWDATFFGLSDSPDPYSLNSSKVIGFKLNTGGNVGLDAYFNGSKVRDWPSNTFAGANTCYRIEILPNKQGVKLYINCEGPAHHRWVDLYGTYPNGRTGTMLPNREDYWELIWETDQPLPGADVKYFGYRKFPDITSVGFGLSIDNVIFAEYAADEKTLALAVGSDYDVSPMNTSLGDSYTNGYNTSYWDATIASDVVFESDGTDGLKMRIPGNGTPVAGTRISNVHTIGGLFYLNSDAGFDIKTTIDLANFPVGGDHSGTVSYVALELASYSDGPETIDDNVIHIRYQVSDTYTRIYMRYRTNGHQSIWMYLDVSGYSTVGLRIKKIGSTVQCLYRKDNGRWEIFNVWIFGVYPGTSNKFSVKLQSYFATQWTTDRSATFKELNVNGINYDTAGTVLGYGTFEYEFDQIELDQQLIYRIKDEDGAVIESASIDVKDTAILNTGAIAKDLVLVGDKTYDAFAGRMSIKNLRTVPFKYNDIDILTRYNIMPNPDADVDSNWSPWFSNGNSRLINKSGLSYNARYIQVKATFNRNNGRLNPKLFNIGFNMDLTWHKDSEPFDEDPVWGIGGSLSWMEIEQDQDISDIGGEHSRFVQVRTTLRS